MGKKSENGKNVPTHKPHCRASAKISFIIAIMRYHLFIGVNEMRVKNITVTVSVRVSAMVRVSLVWFVISNNVGGIKCRHLPNIAGTIAEWL